MIYLFILIYLVIGIPIVMLWKWQWNFGHKETAEQFIIGVMMLAWPITALFTFLVFIGKIPGLLLRKYEKYQEL